jgi:YbbR domain-containing protein
MRKWLTKFLLENTLLKLLSLGFALVLWTYVSLGQSEAEAPARVDLEVKNLPKRLVRVSELPSGLEIKVRGSRTVLRVLRDRQLSYPVDLNGATAGPMAVRIFASGIHGLPKGVRVVEIVPSQIQLSLSERKSKTVRVKPVFRGTLAEGFEVLRVAVEPELVEVSGAKEEIDQLSEVNTETIDLTDRSESFTAEVGLDLINRHVEAVRDERVKVSVQVGEPRTTRTLYGVAVELRGARFRSRLNRADLDVQLEGPKEPLQRLTPGDLRLVIDAEDLEPGLYDMVPVLQAPEGMNLRTVNVPSVQVTVLDKPLKPDKKPAP